MSHIGHMLDAGDRDGQGRSTASDSQSAAADGHHCLHGSVLQRPPLPGDTLHIGTCAHLSVLGVEPINRALL